MTTLTYGKAICYSGYREGQCPDGEIPSKAQIQEDLEILLANGYRYIRMYDPNEHARRVLEIICEHHLPLQCLIGIDNRPEVNNPDCPWEKQNMSAEELKANATRNDAELEKLIALVKEYPDEIFAVSVGNENTPSWGARIVPATRLLRHARRLKEALDKPVTFCEGVAEWPALQELANELDFISVHSYPLHVGCCIEDAFASTKQHFNQIKELYPDKLVIFTEVGWSSKARDDLKRPHASEKNQKQYISEITEWFEQEQIIGFLFEAFDEPWKGVDEDSCERNWGLYYTDRTPKPALQA